MRNPAAQGVGFYLWRDFFTPGHCGSGNNGKETYRTSTQPLFLGRQINASNIEIMSYVAKIVRYMISVTQ